MNKLKRAIVFIQQMMCHAHIQILTLSACFPTIMTMGCKSTTTIDKNVVVFANCHSRRSMPMMQLAFGAESKIMHITMPVFETFTVCYIVTAFRARVTI